MKRIKPSRLFIFISFLALQMPSAWAQITINTSVATDWKISNGAISLDWNSTTGNVFGVHLTGHPDNLVDPTVLSNGQPRGLYMDNVGLGSGTVTSGFSQNGNQYLDWWISTASSSTNAFTYARHFIIRANDPGFHVYLVTDHSATDIAGGLGQIQYVFRISQTLFTNTYSVNPALNTPVAQVALPSPSIMATNDPGRQVQDATIDLHGFSLPAGFGREFYTKYDYTSYEYLHQAHGLFGSTYGAWTVVPRHESLVAGPTKQNLNFTGTILMMEALSNHLNNSFSYTVSHGVASNHLFGPYYFHFNTFTSQNTTPAALYQDALNAAGSVDSLYDADKILLQNGYVPSTGRGTVAPVLSGGGSSQPNTAWVILSDPATNIQFSGKGRQYWTSNNANGNATLNGVAPGTYRLTSYVLGQWGELRHDNVAVTANQTTSLHLAFTPENFGSAPPVWTIGTPDRSAHEFLHGENSQGHDDREFWGNWNYWLDFAATSGKVVYHATNVGSVPATNDLHKWNYVHWRSFDPGLFAGVHNPADDTTDGYKFVAPSFVNPATATTPPWEVHFTTTAAQQAQGTHAVLSVGLAAAEASLTVSLNGQPLTWRLINRSNPMVRSGLSGYYQWIAFEWNSTLLNPPGQDNVITLSVNQTQGVMYDALRMEITNKSADHTVTGWNDYEFISASTDQPANDSLENN